MRANHNLKVLFVAGFGPIVRDQKQSEKFYIEHLAYLEFDVQNIEAASEELKRKGYKLLVSARKEPWGQIVTRLLSPEGILVGITITPSMRKKK